MTDVVGILLRVETGMASAEDAAALRELIAPREHRPCGQLEAARCPVLAEYLKRLAGPCSRQGGCACEATE